MFGGFLVVLLLPGDIGEAEVGRVEVGGFLEEVEVILSGFIELAGFELGDGAVEFGGFVFRVEFEEVVQAGDGADVVGGADIDHALVEEHGTVVGVAAQRLSDERCRFVEAFLLYEDEELIIEEFFAIWVLGILVDSGELVVEEG